MLRSFHWLYSQYRKLGIRRNNRRRTVRELPVESSSQHVRHDFIEHVEKQSFASLTQRQLRALIDTWTNANQLFDNCQSIGVNILVALIGNQNALAAHFGIINVGKEEIDIDMIRNTKNVKVQGLRIENFITQLLKSLPGLPENLLNEQCRRVGAVHFRLGINFDASNWAAFRDVLLDSVVTKPAKQPSHGIDVAMSKIELTDLWVTFMRIVQEQMLFGFIEEALKDFMQMNSPLCDRQKLGGSSSVLTSPGAVTVPSPLYQKRSKLSTVTEFVSAKISIGQRKFTQSLSNLTVMNNESEDLNKTKRGRESPRPSTSSLTPNTTKRGIRSPRPSTSSRSSIWSQDGSIDLKTIAEFRVAFQALNLNQLCSNFFYDFLTEKPSNLRYFKLEETAELVKIYENDAIKKQIRRIELFLTTAVSMIGYVDKVAVASYCQSVGEIHYHRSVNFTADNWLLFMRLVCEAFRKSLLEMQMCKVDCGGSSNGPDRRNQMYLDGLDCCMQQLMRFIVREIKAGFVKAALRAQSKSHGLYDT